MDFDAADLAEYLREAILYFSRITSRDLSPSGAMVRELQRAAATAIERTANDLYPGDSHGVARTKELLSLAFRNHEILPISGDYETLREVLQTAIGRQLAVLDNDESTGRATWADLLGVPTGVLAQRLFDNLLLAIEQLASTDGLLAPVAARLDLEEAAPVIDAEGDDLEAAMQMSAVLRMPRFDDPGDINALAVILQDLSVIYDVTALAVLPGYGSYTLPATRIGPRRYSPLRAEDRLRVKKVSLASPLILTFWLMGGMGAVNAFSRAAERGAQAARAWIDVVGAGVDTQQRKQALEQHRALAPGLERRLELQNLIAEQELRRVTAENDLVDAERLAYLQQGHEHAIEARGHSGDAIARRRRVSSSSSDDIAELLDEPIRRVIGLSGGILDVAIENDGTSDSQVP